MNKVYFLGCFLILHFAGAFADPSDRKKVDIKSYPYTGTLLFHDLPACAGALFRKNVFITAASCMFHVDPALRLYSVRAGSNKSAQGGIVSYNVIKEYDDYDGIIGDKDLLILILEKPFDVTESVNTIKLANKMPNVGEVATLTGWNLSYGPKDDADELHALDMEIVNCADYFKKDQRDGYTDNMFCAKHKTNEFAPCIGDLGAPLTYKGKLIGTVASRNNCEDKNLPTLFTDVVKQREYIRGKVDEYKKRNKKL